MTIVVQKAVKVTQVNAFAKKMLWENVAIVVPMTITDLAGVKGVILATVESLQSTVIATTKLDNASANLG